MLSFPDFMFSNWEYNGIVNLALVSNDIFLDLMNFSNSVISALPSYSDFLPAISTSIDKWAKVQFLSYSSFLIANIKVI